MNSRLLGAFSTSQFTITSIGTAAAMTSGQVTWGRALQGRDPDNNLATLHISLTNGWPGSPSRIRRALRCRGLLVRKPGRGF
jgi:hypothetical protein